MSGTTSLGRAYVTAGTLLVFLVLWAVIAASPWASGGRSPALAALDRREALVRQRAALAEQRHAARWARFRAAVEAAGNRPNRPAAVAQPQVRIVPLPPVATTRSS